MVRSGRGPWLTGVTTLRYPVVIVAAALSPRPSPSGEIDLERGPASSDRSWPWSLANWWLKPLVGRTLGGVLSYPSGSTVGAAALAAAAALASPARWRTVTAIVGSLYALWMALAVIALQWHLPTDAIAGLAYGVGVVLVVDGSAWKVAVAMRQWRAGERSLGAGRRRPSAPRPGRG